MVVRGWVDLREENCRVWVRRAQEVVRQADARGSGTGSDVEWNAMAPDAPIGPARFVVWIFHHEEEGERIKR